MRTRLPVSVLFVCLLLWVQCAGLLFAQEASSGFDLRESLSGQFAASNVFTEAPRSGMPVGAGFRSVTYPTLKFSDHWSVTGVWQLASRPYFNEDFSKTGNGLNGDILQASLNYSRVSGKGSLMIRAGQLSTAFGSFLLRYGDAENPVVDMPMEYGYYYAPVSFLSVAGAQIDATRGKWDGRVQFANSSPANPRSLFEHDQYGNWAGGGGYTIRQGLRVGVSAYRGPYLDRQYAYFFPGEANPSTLQANALGVDAGWARGHWSMQGEVQKFVFPYQAIPTFREQVGYGELKRVLTPRWYIASRIGYTSANEGGNAQSYEGAAGFRPNRFQLIKFDYELRHHSAGPYLNENTLAIQYLTTLHFSAARE
jgi:hypothetical protein